MPTDAEIKLQAKYEAMRKAKEAKALKKQQAEAAAANPKQHPVASAGKGTVATATATKHKTSLAAKTKPAGKAKTSVKLKLKTSATANGNEAAATAVSAATDCQTEETPRDRALRILREQREAKRIATDASIAKARAATGDINPGDESEADCVIPKRQPGGRKAGQAAQDEHQPRSPSLSEDPFPIQPPSQPSEQQQGHQRNPKRPALKRPAARQLPAPTTLQSSEAGMPRRTASAAPVFDGQQSKRPRNDTRESRAHRDAADEARASTLFIGDLPHQLTSQEVEEIFNQLSPVKDANVVGTQCFAFVRFMSPEGARHVMETAAENPIEVHGRQLRVNWSQGALASWKQGSKLVPDVKGAPSLPGIEGLVHPKVREARAAAQAEANAIAPEDLIAIDLRPPPARTLVTYGDL